MTSILKIIVILNLFVFLFSPVSSILAQDKGEDKAIAQSNSETEKIDVYAMFWPVVPGKTVNDSMFWLKQLKESFGEFFSFGDINKSEYQIALSEKRLVESYKLYTEDKDYNNAEKTLAMNKANRDQAVKLMKKAQEEQRKVGELKSRLVPSLENQQLVLKSVVEEISEDRKGKVNEIIEELTLQISEAK